MAGATRSVVLVDDLVRTRLGFALVWMGCYLLTRRRWCIPTGHCPFAALTMDEARELADRAGLQDATFRRHWPERFLLSWSKS